MKANKRKKRTDFQRQYMKIIEYEGRKVQQFPGRYSTPEEGREVGISKDIRMGKGIVPTEVELKSIKGAYNASKSELGYTKIQDLVDLSGLGKEKVHQILTYLTKQGKGIMNVDRWGNAVFIKFKEITGDQ